VRTHLLRTFYPPLETEPDAGAAANDTTYETPAIAAIAKQIVATPAANSAADDYELGGYAGI
jgi:hypothetical protein